MKTSDSTKKSLLIGLATTLFILAVLAPYYLRAPLTQGSPALPIPLGTNQPTIGANLYLSNGFHFGKVMKVERYEFPDGTNRPGALIKPTNTFAIWMPLEKLTNALVVQ